MRLHPLVVTACCAQAANDELREMYGALTDELKGARSALEAAETLTVNRTIQHCIAWPQ